MMAEEKKNNGNVSILKTLGSLQFGLVLLVTLTIVAIIGTLIPQGLGYDFYHERYGTIADNVIFVFGFDDVYHSPLFIGLVGLLGINIILCSFSRFPGIVRKTFRPNIILNRDHMARMPIHISLTSGTIESIQKRFERAGFFLRPIGENRLFGEKKRLGYLGSPLVHVSLIVLLIGGLISLVSGLRGQIVLTEGESSAEAEITAHQTVPLDFTVTLDSFHVAFYENYPERPKMFSSSVTVTFPDGRQMAKDIQVNHPLMVNGFTIYQSSYGVTDQQKEAISQNDTATVALYLKSGFRRMPFITFNMTGEDAYLVPGFGDSIAIRLAEVHENFRGDAQSGEKNPAVKVDVMVHDTLRWSVYVFKKFPKLNMPMYEDIPLTFSLVDLAVASRELGYYTVLGVVKDRGVTAMWAGALLMMVGLVLSFYVRPKRIWVMKEGSELLVSAFTRGDHSAFEAYVKNIVTHDSTHGETDESNG